MIPFPPTIILRHRKENLKKCTLSRLEGRRDVHFYSYPSPHPLPLMNGYIVLTLGAPPLEATDRDRGLFLIDGTWRYAQKMLASLKPPFERRSLPLSGPLGDIHTVYPRTQQDCIDPRQGLASIEALYLAYLILGRETKGILDHYHWKEQFLSQISNPQRTFPFSDELE